MDKTKIQSWVNFCLHPPKIHFTGLPAGHTPRTRPSERQPCNTLNKTVVYPYNGVFSQRKGKLRRGKNLLYFLFTTSTDQKTYRKDGEVLRTEVGKKSIFSKHNFILAGRWKDTSCINVDSLILKFLFPINYCLNLQFSKEKNQSSFWHLTSIIIGVWVIAWIIITPSTFSIIIFWIPLPERKHTNIKKLLFHLNIF